MLNVVDIAVIQNEELDNNNSFKQAMDYLSNEKNSNRLFSTRYVSEEEASALLEKGEISGYVKLTAENPKIVVDKNGVDQTIIKYAVEEIYQSQDSYEELYKNIESIFNKEDGQSFFDRIKSLVIMLTKNNINIKDTSKSNLSYTMIEYYTLIAMTCMYGGIIGAVAISWILANMTNIGKRTSVSPSSKLTMILSSCMASYVVQIIGIAILFAFTIFGLKVDYGDKLPQIILLSSIGCLAGLSLGLAVSTTVKSGEGAKVGIILAITMTGSFLSGMMGVTMKYIIDKNAPIINKLNPVNMITDGFYSLYYYDTLDRFNFNVASLAIFSVIMLVISVMTLRRQKYDNI
ncbi:MAG: ABC transporter permease [Clostridia bacterium]|nr:ABC transporter permease [Clostridia bacterium]